MAPSAEPPPDRSWVTTESVHETLRRPTRYTGVRLPTQLRERLDSEVSAGHASSLTDLVIRSLSYALTHMPKGWTPQ